MEDHEAHKEIYYHPLRSRTRRLGEPFDRENQMLRAFKLRSTASEIPATLSGEIQRGRGVAAVSAALLAHTGETPVTP